MYRLSNAHLTLQVLDPVADEDRLGTRYVSGCYVYAVVDSKLGNMLAGPVYPHDPPAVFHGQGMPEAFRDSLAVDDGRRMVIGNAIVSQEPDPDEMNTWQIEERCTWEVEHGDTQLRMATQQRLGDWSVQVERRLVLNDRGVLSETRVTNDGPEVLPLVWYAHPFFPWPDDGVCRSFTSDLTMPENPGFGLDDEGQIVRKADHDWDKGQFVKIEGCQGRDVRAQYHHPRGQITVHNDFELAQMPIWGNSCTVSFEPHLEKTLASSTVFSWSLVYSFEE